MRTNGYSWTGISAEMVCGSMSVSSGGTVRNYMCLQMGDLTGLRLWLRIIMVKLINGIPMTQTREPGYCAEIKLQLPLQLTPTL